MGPACRGDIEVEYRQWSYCTSGKWKVEPDWTEHQTRIIIIRRLKVETELAVADRKGVEEEEGRNAIGEVGEKN